VLAENGGDELLRLAIERKKLLAHEYRTNGVQAFSGLIQELVEWSESAPTTLVAASRLSLLARSEHLSRERVNAVLQANHAVSAKRWRTAKKHSLIPAKPPRPPKRILPVGVRAHVAAFFNNQIVDEGKNIYVTRPCSHRTVWVRGNGGLKEKVNVLFLLDSVAGAYRNYTALFPEGHPQHLSESAFRSAVPKNVRPAKQDSDKCPTCHHKKLCLAELSKLPDVPENAAIRQQLQDDIKTVERHRSEADQASSAFDLKSKTLKAGELLIHWDYKQNMVLGQGSSSWDPTTSAPSQSQSSVFGL
jgi:hypothetical protein